MRGDNPHSPDLPPAALFLPARLDVASLGLDAWDGEEAQARYLLSILLASLSSLASLAAATASGNVNDPSGALTLRCWALASLDTIQQLVDVTASSPSCSSLPGSQHLSGLRDLYCSDERHARRNGMDLLLEELSSG